MPVKIELGTSMGTWRRISFGPAIHDDDNECIIANALIDAALITGSHLLGETLRIVVTFTNRVASSSTVQVKIHLDIYQSGILLTGI